MKHPTTRRAAITALGAGAASLASLSLLPPNVAFAAISSAAGVVAGGSLEGPNGPIQFSAFGSRLQLDDVAEPVLHGALAWYDLAGMDGAPLTIALIAVDSYGPGDIETARVMTGTASVNGEGEHRFGLRLVDGGEIGAAADMIRLAIGSAAGEVSGTPVPADAGIGFDYDVEGELMTGDVQVIAF
ncbi:MAG: hypothetical protein M3457_07375 [Chloroflexota bacterium]|nr:hypothetical protein [Chloroflexota bacterium]